MTANNVARWNTRTETWAPLAGGVSGRTGPAQENDVVVDALAISGGDVYVGGSFVKAGDLPSHNIGRWVATAPTETATITPAAGGALTNPDLALHFPPGAVAPSGAVAEAVTVRYTPLAAGHHLPANGRSSLRSWALEARTADGAVVAHFLQPYTLSVPYTDAEVTGQGLDENSLNVAYWNGVAWVPMLPCAGCAVDTEANEVTVVADHFTEFALTGGTVPVSTSRNAVYLPVVVR